jgi:hypothetical protein
MMRINHAESGSISRRMVPKDMPPLKVKFMTPPFSTCMEGIDVNRALIPIVIKAAIDFKCAGSSGIIRTEEPTIAQVVITKNSAFMIYDQATDKSNSFALNVKKAPHFLPTVAGCSGYAFNLSAQSAKALINAFIAPVNLIDIMDRACSVCR